MGRQTDKKNDCQIGKYTERDRDLYLIMEFVKNTFGSLESRVELNW